MVTSREAKATRESTTTVAAPTRASRRRSPGGSRRVRGQGRLAAMLISPFIVLFALSYLAPLIYAAWLSLHSEQRSGLGFGGGETIFVGLGNYSTVLTDPAFLSSFRTLAMYFIVYVPLMTIAALCAALLLDAATAKLRRMFQLLIFLPHAVPGIIAALIWGYLYTPSVSPLVRTLADGGISINFLSTEWVLPSIINIAVWEWTGYNMIILFTALQAVNRELIEAARIDGASGWRIAWSVKAPIVRPAYAVILLFTVIGSLQLFSEPLVLRQMSTAVNSTFVPNMWAYNAAFSRDNLGEATAAALILALLAAGLSLVVTRWSNRSSEK